MEELTLETKDDVALEGLVDKYGFRAVLMALGAVAAAKADHLENFWKEKALAAAFVDASRELQRASVSPAVVRVRGAFVRRF